MNKKLNKSLWFVLFWVGGVVALLIISSVIKLFLS